MADPTEMVAVVPEETPDETPAPDPQETLRKDVEKSFRLKIEESKKHRRTFVPHWRSNIERRLGEPSTLSGGDLRTSDDDEEPRSLINPDWALTKTKTANLYSQVPTVQLTHEGTQYAPAIPPFAKALNYELGEKRANVGVPMEEVLNDVVNASGIGAVFVGYAARFETKQVPVEEMFQSPEGPIPTKTLTPEQVQQLAAVGLLHLQDVEQVVDDKFFVSRISPGDLLWPKNFKGSNFDNADWIGQSCQGPWAVVKLEFTKLREDQKSEAIGEANHSSDDDLRSSSDRQSAEDETVTYDDLYYWRYRVDPDEKSFCAIWRIVFVHGIEEPVLHEPWKGQQYVEETREYVGSKKFPIRVLTLTYISDHPVPPSDSAAGRPQVNDLRRSRSQMFMNRERSIPVRGFDSNRVDTLIQANLQRGTYQGWIPFNGDPTRAIYELARASYPKEDFEFDRQTKTDLMETWQIGPNQQGTTASGITATESNNVQANFSTRIGQERGSTSSFFLGVVEVLAGWMVLYGRFPSLSDQERQAMESAWDRKRILHDLVMKIRPDSTIVLDSSQRIERLTKFLNITGKSGAVDIAPIIAEIAELSGIDPTTVMKKPEPPPPEEPNISLRLSGKDDLVNPLVMAMLILLKKAPTLDGIAEAQKLLQAAAALPPPPQPPQVPGPEGPLAPGSEAPVPESGAPPDDWGLMDHVAKRSRDMGGE